MVSVAVNELLKTLEKKGGSIMVDDLIKQNHPIVQGIFDPKDLARRFSGLQSAGLIYYTSLIRIAPKGQLELKKLNASELEKKIINVLENAKSTLGDLVKVLKQNFKSFKKASNSRREKIVNTILDELKKLGLVTEQEGFYSLIT